MRRWAQAAAKVIRETLAHAGEGNVRVVAGSLAFTTVLSLPPLLAVVFFALQAGGVLEKGFERLQPIIFENLTPGTGAVVSDQLQTFLHNSRAGAVGVFGIAGLLFTALLTFKQIHWAINRVMGFQQKTRTTRLLRKALVFLAAGPVLVIASVALTVWVPVGALPLALCMDFLVFALIYKVLPNEKIPMKPVMGAAFITAIAWEIAKAGYTWYTLRAVSYSKVYGSFSALPLFLIWIYVAWYIVLGGTALLRALSGPRKKGAPQ